MIPIISYHGTFKLALRNHTLFFVKYNLTAYEGSFGPKLFLESSQRTSSIIRTHLASLFQGEKFVDFKRRAEILKPHEAPSFVDKIYVQIAQDLMRVRLAA